MGRTTRNSTAESNERGLSSKPATLEFRRFDNGQLSALEVFQETIQTLPAILHDNGVRRAERLHSGYNRPPKAQKGCNPESCNLSILLVGRMGIEPTTNGLKVRCSTGLS